MAERETRLSPFPTAPIEEGLGSYSAQGARRWLDPVTSHGRFFAVRAVIGYALVAVFLAAPHLRIGGHPALHLDLDARLFHLFGLTLHPTDNLLLLFFGLGATLALVLVTSLWGRLWCGFFCPQPIYLEFLFRPLETLLEGPPHVRRRRDSGPRSAGRVARKLVKWSIYLAISLFLAHTFFAYFTGWSTLVAWVSGPPQAHWGVFLGVLILTAMIFADFAGFRELTCAMACPWGRLQTVLYDPDTVLVGYDARRGEPRGRARSREAGATAPGEGGTADGAGATAPAGAEGTAASAAVRGDCIDCARCVVTCPTGIDIRRGLQLECIGCAQCVDACDDVMTRLRRPRGLIRFASQRQLAGGATRLLRGRTLIYVGTLLAVATVLLALLSTRSPAEADLLRAREPYRQLESGEVANQLRVRLTNLTDRRQSFLLELLAPARAKLVVSVSPFVLEAQEVETLNVVVTAPYDAFRNGRTTARLRLRSDSGFDKTAELMLLGPYHQETKAR